MSGPFEAVDGLRLEGALVTLLKPAEAVSDDLGNIHFLPRFFYEVPSWEEAKKARISEHFTFAELMSVDCREARPLLDSFPHYVPCAICVLGRYLEAFRQKVEAPVFISVNGGYRSSAHKRNKVTGPHSWGTAADIYRIGDTFLDTRRDIEKYGEIARSLGAEVFAKPAGEGQGKTDDHLHIDIGYVSYVPREHGEGR